MKFWNNYERVPVWRTRKSQMLSLPGFSFCEISGVIFEWSLTMRLNNALKKNYRYPYKGTIMYVLFSSQSHYETTSIFFSLLSCINSRKECERYANSYRDEIFTWICFGRKSICKKRIHAYDHYLKLKKRMPIRGSVWENFLRIERNAGDRTHR